MRLQSPYPPNSEKPTWPTVEQVPPTTMRPCCAASSYSCQKSTPAPNVTAPPTGASHPSGTKELCHSVSVSQCVQRSRLPSTAERPNQSCPVLLTETARPCSAANCTACWASTALRMRTAFAAVALEADHPGLVGEPMAPLCCMPPAWSRSHRGSEKAAPLGLDRSTAATSSSGTC